MKPQGRELKMWVENIGSELEIRGSCRQCTAGHTRMQRKQADELRLQGRNVYEIKNLEIREGRWSRRDSQGFLRYAFWSLLLGGNGEKEVILVLDSHEKVLCGQIYEQSKTCWSGQAPALPAKRGSTRKAMKVQYSKSDFAGKVQ